MSPNIPLMRVVCQYSHKKRIQGNTTHAFLYREGDNAPGAHYTGFFIGRGTMPPGAHYTGIFIGRGTMHPGAHYTGFFIGRGTMHPGYTTQAFL
jgi:hypothetical protein